VSSTRWARVGLRSGVGYWRTACRLARKGLPITSGDVREFEPRELKDLAQWGASGRGRRARTLGKPSGAFAGAKLIPQANDAPLTELDVSAVAVICASGRAASQRRRC